ncbi:Uncharacterised protein [Salmonella enterica subsp. enterica]|nr:Uncharacterised protein [Salmonella enterica subsp. enterica]
MMMMHEKSKMRKSRAAAARGSRPAGEYLFKMRTIINNYHLMIIYFILRY